MKNSSKKKNQISRRGFLPMLGGGLILPLLGFGKPSPEALGEDSDAYQTMLKADGTTVRVKKSVLENAKVIEKNISNKSFLGWLNKDK
ncbi:MAG: hypothetical protein COZ75_09980 [Flavobacteriaceae bacterium CG_4_8_14_3_um_filter_34_10]|nr:hypothetical protein [Flavobacteriia bacterium]OIP52410.1 MAG: hypothetical protein AUK33_01025 [Flavobacteriaceae bacterium CG2_30_34_30]PIQ17296.1 MAG: hypothetical protein COW66_12570 [Flavobacteriaceae bacterium CG18_big_fil_WC_8_21_14_2_50_34_36]PIV49634.1 MAG: hypothetical protein COS19_07645 [Flavobacteriaceae bacterium CG02_land_8_20_14_3_00_34_13]PIX08823.1 MAG: hypothetical protein COZ75_09980 [Flavobacteriaceae bacterium CG_4_8_14_3_um_filter_34_10]PIZ07633.1 MAG: hypothetical pr